VAADLRAESALGPEAAALRQRGVELVLGEQHPSILEGVDLVVLSPGVPLDTPIPAAARERGVPMIGELELAYRASEGTWLAVTGTNGKTTTTALLGELVAATGRPVTVTGNIGLAASSEVRDVPKDGLVVAEVSSFQLDTADEFRPHVAVLLNITEDHLDRYDSFDHYAESKRRIFMNQTADDYAVLNVDDPRVASFADGIGARVIPVSTEREVPDGVFVRDGTIVSGVGGVEEEILEAKDLGVPGPHNLANALAAVAAASAVGVAAPEAAEVLRAFAPLEHRLEPVAEVDGVLYVNDSKATNVDAVGFALRSYDAPIVLVAGGREKDTDFSPLAGPVAERVRRLVLIGEAADKMERALEGLAPISRAGSLREAVVMARNAAAPGDVVLLSPACASFDMFDDFEDRGRKFKEEVARLGPRS
jgi:UDP-N-acetylmuramoylalanine--D-glutamate ligase